MFVGRQKREAILSPFLSRHWNHSIYAHLFVLIDISKQVDILLKNTGEISLFFKSFIGTDALSYDQGYIPAKNNHVYGKTAGKASDLAAAAEKTLSKRENANSMMELVEIPPQVSL